MRWKIIKQLSGKNMYGFTIQDVQSEFPERSRVYLTRILADMVNIGMLYKIARDNFHIIPINADPETYVPCRHQVAKYLMQNKEYYIGYTSALEIHGLKIHGLKIHGLMNHGPRRQTEAREYVVTNKPTKPTIRRFGEIRYEIIRHELNRFFGFSSMWINQFEQAMVSDLEKTIVDMATKPQLCEGIIEVGNAIFHAKDRTDRNKLFYYFARNNNKSAKKRFLFLTDLLGLEWTSDHDRMMEELGTGISLLDPSAPDQGRKRSKFGLKVNVDPIHIREQVFHSKIS